MTAVAIIPARGGSRRIEHKNRKLFHGKPIIAYSIEVAKQSGLFAGIYVSTEDEEIAKVAIEYGAMIWWRPAYLSDDNVGTQVVTRDAIFGLSEAGGPDYDYACCIYATAPMMTAEDLQRGFHSLQKYGSFAFIPGWFYWGTKQAFLDHVPLPTSEENDERIKRMVERNLLGQSLEGRWIDIDTPEDWTRAEQMYTTLHKEKT